MGTTGWNKFFDLSNPADVTLLMGPTGTTGLISSIQRDGGTNWEDALHRAYYTNTGVPYRDAGNPATPEPEMVVFFTDGEPTFDREAHDSDSSSVGPASIPSRFDWETAGNTNYGADFSPRGWYRADDIVDDFREIRFIGVGVGSAFDESTKVNHSGWPYTGNKNNKKYTPIPKEVFLGDLTAGGDPSQYGTSSSGGYVVRRYSSSSGWGDVSNANLLVTNDMSKFGSALTEIALAECGGTLTVQTRDQAGNPADAKITYQIGDEVVTTTRIAKAGTFDIPLNGIPSATVDLVPQSFDGTGYTPSSWSCRAGGVALTQGSDYDLITGNAGDGISVTVSANAAVSCTLSVSP
jgi:hypothetical protein